MSRISLLAIAGSDTIERLRLTCYRPAIWMGVTILLFILVRIGKVEANKKIDPCTFKHTFEVYAPVNFASSSSGSYCIVCFPLRKAQSTQVAVAALTVRPRGRQWH